MLLAGCIYFRGRSARAPPLQPMCGTNPIHRKHHIHVLWYKGKVFFIKMLNNVGMAVPKIIQTRCSTYAARQCMLAYNNNNMRNPIIKDVGRGLRMLLLLYAIIHCLAAYVLHLVCTIFGSANHTLFNILMKMLLLHSFYDCT